MRILLLFLLTLATLIKGSDSASIIINASSSIATMLDNNNTDDEDKDENSCQLMDGFAIFIQISLCFTALLTLIYKRSKESPQRPVQIWALDVSKQFVGAGMIHFINIGISYAASQPNHHSRATNLCTWYFLNVAIDTTLGVFILWCWFNLISLTLEYFNIKKGLKTGEYGSPPLSNMMIPWIRQMAVFLLAEILAKACLYVILMNSPWLFWLGDLCIKLTPNERFQVVFVMLIFPLIMNAIQFWLTDTILKMQEITSTKDMESKNTSFMIHPHPPPPLLSTPSSLKNNSYFSTPMFAVLVEQSERTPLLFPPSKHRMSS